VDGNLLLVGRTKAPRNRQPFGKGPGDQPGMVCRELLATDKGIPVQLEQKTHRKRAELGKRLIARRQRRGLAQE
jgi:hypothetical protein